MSTKQRVSRIGAHVSISGGPQTAPERAVELGATAIGMFTKNQRQWQSKPLTDEEIAAFGSNLTRSGIDQRHVVIHASYLLNPGNPDPEKRAKSAAALLDECRRAEALGLTLVNFHPGSGLGQIGESEAIDLIATVAREVLAETEHAVLVLETTAGQGDHVGYRFEHLADIIDRAGSPERIGVCIDSCHIYSAGYDVRSDEAYAATTDAFARTVGFDRLVGVHLNDSMVELGSRKDRHERIGAGEIGLAGLARFVTDERMADVPFVLETNHPEIWAQEIALLRGIAEGRIEAASAEPPPIGQEESEG